MRAATVCVDFGELLSESLAYNRHHFDECLIVTSPADTVTQEVANRHGATLHVTDAFYRDGAFFNKYRAMEEGLDVFGRHGWMLILDADIFLPTRLPDFELTIGNLYGPRRRMIPALPLPPEDQWDSYPPCRNTVELSGYFHLFHADDPRLPKPHWYQTNWKHAGGADSFLERRWPAENKIRPPFSVAHIGEQGKHWCGVGNTQQLERLMQRRRQQSTHKYAHELIDP